MTRPRVIIVGCGSIAGGYDAGAREDEYPLSHAGAYRRHGGFDLLACVEPDGARRAAFMARWGCASGAASMRELVGDGLEADVVTICSPTVVHGEHLAAALEFRPRLVVCEKPVTPTLEETRYWVERYEQAGVALLVNHTRRWDSAVVRVAHELRSGARGELRCVTALYNKGLMNNGSHLADALRMTCGELSVVSAGKPRADHFPSDPSVPFMLLSAAGVPVTANISHSVDFALFELQFVTSKGMLTMEGGGQRWRERSVVASATFPGYREVDRGVWRDGEYRAAMLAMVANQYGFLVRSEPLACIGRDALEAQQLCAAIRASASAAHGTDRIQCSTQALTYD